MSRSRRLQRLSSASNSSSSSSTSPERGIDDDNDSFMQHANDSQSSLGMDISPDTSDYAAARRAYDERCRISPVHRLPAELLIAIFSRLNSPSDLQTCMLVCKEWARNSVGLLWHRPAMNKWDSIHSVVQSIRKANKFFAYQDLVKRLNMATLASGVSDGTLLGMAECKRIERLTLTNCAKLTDMSIQPLVSGNRSLLALDVTNLDQLTDKSMMTVADNCLRLQGLNVTGCKKITDTSIAAVARSCRHLKRLKFNNCAQLTDHAVMTIAAHSTHLLEIDLYGLQNLESPAITALLTSCPHLREMRLAHCTRINDSAFLDIPFEPDLPFSIDSLRILDLTDCSDLGDKAIEKIIYCAPRLRNLILAKCRQLTDRAVFAITRLGKNLHYIHLGHCNRITDVSVEALAKNCTRIRYIDLACCNALTDSSVMKLAGLPKLKRIGLVKCAGITDRSIYALAMGEIRNDSKINGTSVLERVHLSYCTLLTLDGIHILLTHCPKLTHLSLTGVQAFLRDDLLAFCREAPPEFNDHQRDVFCVFSGTGVGRLREFLNHQKARQHQAVLNAAVNGVHEGGLALGASETPSIIMGEGSEMGDVDDGNPESDGEGDGNTGGVLHMNVHAQHHHHHHHGSTPIIRTPPAQGTVGGFAPPPPPPPPSSMPFTHAQPWQYPHPPQHFYHTSWDNDGGSRDNHVASSSQQHHHLSSSAPASITPGALLWNGPSLSHFAVPNYHPHQSQQQQYGGHGGIGGGAQHVTGTMGAMVLDEVDEGDETFGEEGGSEGMAD